MDEVRNYILFPSYNSGLALEALLKKEQIKYTIVPTPRELSTCCGISILYNKEDEEKIKSIIASHSISISGFHSVKKKYQNYYV